MFQIKRTTVLFLSLLWCVLLINSAKGTIEGKTTSSISPTDTAFARHLFEMADLYGKNAKFDSAILLFTQAGSIYQKASIFEKLAKCQNKICEQFLTSGAVVQARSFAYAALKTGLQHKALQEVGSSYNSIGVICNYLGKPDSAMYFFKKALDIGLMDKGEKQAYVPEVYANLAVLYYQKEDYNEAIRLIMKAIKLTRELPGNLDDNMAFYYHTVGSINQKKGDYPSAVSYYKKAIGIWLPKYHDSHPLIGSMYNNLGEIYREVGNFSEALIYLNKSAFIMESAAGGHDLRLAASLQNIANVQVRMKDLSAALVSQKRSLEICLAAGTDPIRIGSGYNSLGRIYYDQGKYDSAEFFFKKGIAAIANFTENSHELSQMFSNLGLLYYKTGKFAEGEVFMFRAIKLFQNNLGEKHPRIASFYYNLGSIYIKQNKLDMALKYFQKSIISNLIGFNDSVYTHNPVLRDVLDKMVLLITLDDKANVFVKKYYREHDSVQTLKYALATYELAIQLTDSMRSENKLEDTQMYLDKESLPYSNAINCAYILYHRTGDKQYLDKAFNFSEKSRYSSLNSSMKELEARNIGGIPDSLQELERSIHISLAYAKKCIRDEKLNKKPDLKIIRKWEQRQFILNNVSDSLKKSFEQDYPGYFRFKYDRQIATINEVRQHLRDDQVLIEYAITDSKLITFIISPFTVSMISCPIDSNFNHNIDRFRQLILLKETNEHSVADYCSVAGKLYDKLFANAEPLIKGKTLIIIPDSKLGTIPMEALVKGNCDGADMSFKTLPYLVRTHAIGYGCSATIYLNSLEMKIRNSGSGFLGFAPSFNPGNKTLIIDLKERGKEYVTLVGSREEVLSIQQQIGGKVFIDTAATKLNFLKYSPKYNILHISTHGIMDDVKPMESKLIFYQKNDSVEANLYAYELFDLKLNASLVVLSACNTGFGKIEDGEGIMSLSSGFMYAGVPSVISTLYSVNDISTSVIMKDFYKYLSRKEEKPVALRNAQIAYLDGADNITAHPFYWAGYICIGSSKAISTKNGWQMVGIAALFLVLFGFGIIILKKRKKNQPV